MAKKVVEVIIERCQKIRAPIKGHFVVYVGSEMRRYVVPMSYLRHPLFQELLDKAAEEYGFHHTNGILLPCDDYNFQQLLLILQHSNSS